MLKVDLNSDLGEGFGAYKSGDDEQLLTIVTSAHVACGFHAGDPEIMARTFRVAKSNGVTVGAHPGFPDLWGFGRRRIPFSIGEIERIVAYQVGAAQAMANYAGHHLSYIKTHGALGNMAAADKEIAGAIARAVKAVDGSLAVVSIALSEQAEAAEALGLSVFHEIFADRGFGENGQLIPRGQPGAIVEDANEAASRVLEMVRAGAVITVQGNERPSRIDTVCVHADSPHAVATARCVRETLLSAGVELAPFIKTSR